MVAATVEQPTIRREFVTVTEFAEIVGVSERHVYDLLAEGRVGSVKLGTLRRIPRSEVERLKREARRNGA